MNNLPTIPAGPLYPETLQDPAFMPSPEDLWTDESARNDLLKWGRISLNALQLHFIHGKFFNTRLTPKPVTPTQNTVTVFNDQDITRVACKYRNTPSSEVFFQITGSRPDIRVNAISAFTVSRPSNVGELEKSLTIYFFRVKHRVATGRITFVEGAIYELLFLRITSMLESEFGIRLEMPVPERSRNLFQNFAAVAEDREENE